MKVLVDLKTTVSALAAAVILTACGGSAPVSIADLPTYTGATALQPGNSPIATTLKNNETQAASMGQKLEQKAFSLPKDATWDKITAFYSEQLKAKGWKEGVAGGIAGGMANEMASKALAQANAGNDMLKTTILNRGKQTLTILRLASNPNDKTDAQLLLSLNTH